MTEAEVVIWALGLVYIGVAIWAARRIGDRIGWGTGWAWLIIWPLVNLAFVAVLFWHALPEAGRSRWLTLLAIVPLANEGMLLFLAFSRWPPVVETPVGPPTLNLAGVFAPLEARPVGNALVEGEHELHK